jgi:2-amino-4-hydroxy-6-hydroxymethyldihydropteridine diphosphokinase
MPRALVSLGSNLGDRRRLLDDAVAVVGRLPQTTLVARSSWYETSPVGGPPGQTPFLNGVVVVETAVAPEQLLAELLTIETALGRVREMPWGPRTIDLDLLLYDDVVLRTERLTLPHPRLAFRKFVLRGAGEIAGDWRHPQLDRTLGELADHLERTPRYVALVGRPHGFRSQLAAEAAHAAGARLVEPTPAGIAGSVDELGSDGLTTAGAIEFLDARAEAVRRSSADAAEAWLIDDAWLVAEAVELLARFDDEASRDRLREAIRRQAASDVTPRLIVSLDGNDAPADLRRAAPEWVTLPPVVVVNIADREAALMEIAAALDAAA